MGWIIPFIQINLADHQRYLPFRNDTVLHFSLTAEGIMLVICYMARYLGIISEQDAELGSLDEWLYCIIEILIDSIVLFFEMCFSLCLSFLWSSNLKLYPGLCLFALSWPPYPDSADSVFMISFKSLCSLSLP